MSIPHDEGILKYLELWPAQPGLDDRVQRIIAFGSGWEGWAQVELGLFLRGQFGNDHVDREVHLYEYNRLSADLLITENNKAIHIFELKAKADNLDPADFQAALDDDIFKVQQNKRKQPCEKAKLWVVGFYRGDFERTKDKEK